MSSTVHCSYCKSVICDEQGLFLYRTANFVHIGCRDPQLGVRTKVDVHKEAFDNDGKRKLILKDNTVHCRKCLHQIGVLLATQNGFQPSLSSKHLQTRDGMSLLHTKFKLASAQPILKTSAPTTLQTVNVSSCFIKELQILYSRVLDDPTTETVSSFLAMVLRLKKTEGHITFKLDTKSSMSWIESIDAIYPICKQYSTMAETELLNLFDSLAVKGQEIDDEHFLVCPLVWTESLNNQSPVQKVCYRSPLSTAPKTYLQWTGKQWTVKTNYGTLAFNYPNRMVERKHESVSYV